VRQEKKKERKNREKLEDLFDPPCRIDPGDDPGKKIS